MSGSWSRSISSPCPPPRFECYLPCSCLLITAGGCFTSTSREHPTAFWTGQQVVEAFPEDTAPRYLLGDRDKIYGEDFQERVQGMGITEVKIALQSPWQSPFAERLVGSVRARMFRSRDRAGRAASTQDFSQLLRLLPTVQNPLVAEQGCSPSRGVHGPDAGEVVELPQVGGLHHRYERRVA